MADTQRFDDIPVMWQVDDIDVNASLTRPDGDGPFPAVIMVAGSGPTDRNWNSPLIPGTNGSAALLAQALTAAGFVTLRYDKRASGPHIQENVPRMLGKISMQGHREELAGGVRLLADRKDVDTHHIFVLTNSEGCIHALNYQIQPTTLPLAGLVLTSAFAQPAGVLARTQIAAQFAAMPNGDQFMNAYDTAMVDFAADRPVHIGENLPEFLRNVILGVTNPINQPFARELWITDPLTLLVKITAPVLIVLGKKDIQVDWLTDGPLFESIARDHANLTIRYSDNANHVLKYEPRDRTQIPAADAMLTYSGADTQLDSGTVKTITAWLGAHLKTAGPALP